MDKDNFVPKPKEPGSKVKTGQVSAFFTEQDTSYNPTYDVNWERAIGARSLVLKYVKSTWGFVSQTCIDIKKKKIKKNK